MRTSLSKNDLEAIRRARAKAEIEAEAPKEPEPQGYTEQILKHIPAEVVAFYIPALAAAAALKPTTTGTATTSYDSVVWAIFLLALVGTFIYMHKNAKTELEKTGIGNVGDRAFLKAAISTLAFSFWALYLGGPFVFVEGYETYGTLAILGFTFLTPAIYDAIPIPFPSLLRKQQQQQPT